MFIEFVNERSKMQKKSRSVAPIFLAKDPHYCCERRDQRNFYSELKAKLANTPIQNLRLEEWA